MKRHGYLYEKIHELNNLRVAYKLAREGKTHYREVQRIDKNPDKYLKRIQKSLIEETYKTSQYEVFEKWEGGKLRVIQALPFFPDRIVHHAIMLVCGEFWKRSLIRDTFQSLPGRGTHDVRRRVQKHIAEENPMYYLQLDVNKFYPSIKHWVVEKYAIDKFIKCPRTIKLLKEILHSIEGLPIGSFLSQIWGNLVISPIDWFIKQDLGLKGYYRYCDDLVIFGDSKDELHEIREVVSSHISELHLNVKDSWVLHSVEDNGLDFCGYVFKKSGTRVRSKIKDNFKSSVKENKLESLPSYWGWIKPLKDKNLWDYAEGYL